MAEGGETTFANVTCEASSNREDSIDIDSSSIPNSNRDVIKENLHSDYSGFLCLSTE